MEPNETSSFFRKNGKYFVAGAIVIVAIVAGIFVLGGDRNKTVKINGASQNSTKTPAGQSSDTKDGKALAQSITPCELLSDQERAKFNLAAGEADNKHIRGCDWDDSGVLYTHASIYPTYGLDKFDRSDATSKPLTIGSHQARLIEPHQNSPVYGTCEIAVAVGSDQSASVVITANGSYSKAPNQAKYCGIVQQLATYVEKRLP